MLIIVANAIMRAIAYIFLKVIILKENVFVKKVIMMIIKTLFAKNVQILGIFSSLYIFNLSTICFCTKTDRRIKCLECKEDYVLLNSHCEILEVKNCLEPVIDYILNSIICIQCNEGYYISEDKKSCE